MVKPPVCILSPDDVSKTVAVIKKSRLEHLLMKPRAVEAKSYGKLDISYKCFLIGCGVYSVGIESLIQHQPLKDRFSID